MPPGMPAGLWPSRELPVLQRANDFIRYLDQPANRPALDAGLVLFLRIVRVNEKDWVGRILCLEMIERRASARIA